MNMELWYNDEHFEPDVKVKFQLLAVLITGRNLGNNMFLTAHYRYVHN
jgi:hypothetical protein